MNFRILSVLGVIALAVAVWFFLSRRCRGKACLA